MGSSPIAVTYTPMILKKVFQYNSLRYITFCYIIIHFIIFHYNSLWSYFWGIDELKHITLQNWNELKSSFRSTSEGLAPCMSNLVQFHKKIILYSLILPQFHIYLMKKRRSHLNICALVLSPKKSTSGQLFFYKVTLVNDNPKLLSSEFILLFSNKRYMQIDWRLNIFTAHF